MSIFVPNSPAVNRNARPCRGKPKTPDPTSIAFLSPKTSRTPGKGAVLLGKNVEHDRRAKECDGVIYHRKIPEPDENPNKDVRKNCHVCKAKTDWFCTGCRRYLCCKPAAIIQPPTKKQVKGKLKRAEDDSSSDSDSSEGTILKAHKLPKKFSTLVPKINPETGEVMIDRKTGEPLFVEEWGQYTCYVHAHRAKWKIKSLVDNKGLMQDISKRHRESRG